MEFTPIGYMNSCYSTKNGTPRQSSISSVSKGKLQILKSVFNNPEHSLEGLTEYSHVWIIFAFHLNSNKSAKAKVRPPRMNGLKTGVFSTRSPHRVNPVGLTLAKLDSIEYDTLYMSGIDIVDGTPVLDIKPFIGYCDNPKTLHVLSSKDSFTEVNENTTSQYGTTNADIKVIDDISVDEKRCLDNSALSKLNSNNNETVSEVEANKDLSCQFAKWISNPPVLDLNVVFSNRALDNLKKYSFVKDKTVTSDSDWILNYLKPEDLQQAIIDVLKADPRSTYRRKKCLDRLYYFTIDNVHVTAWFDEFPTSDCVEILRIVPKKLISFHSSQ